MQMLVFLVHFFFFFSDDIFLGMIIFLGGDIEVFAKMDFWKISRGITIKNPSRKRFFCFF